jgi:hypothetical protein
MKLCRGIVDKQLIFVSAEWCMSSQIWAVESNPQIFGILLEANVTPFDLTDTDGETKKEQIQALYPSEKERSQNLSSRELEIKVEIKINRARESKRERDLSRRLE